MSEVNADPGYSHIFNCPSLKGGDCTCRPSKVRFKGGEFFRFSICADPTGVLTPGEEYDVDRVEIRSWHTRYYLKGHAEPFNASMFEAVA